VVPVDTKVENEAWDLIDYMMSDSVYSRYASIGGVIPTVKSVADEEVYRNDEFLKTFVSQEMETVQPFPRFYQVMDILGAYIERFCYGRLSVEETLERAEKEINALLAVT
ncbi:MAG: hypothetical protein HKN43_00580, partial [Rhodothermales bacterium]|nr:hypothetical protein [Rhodothermales bacterium]